LSQPKWYPDLAKHPGGEGTNRPQLRITKLDKYGYLKFKGIAPVLRREVDGILLYYKYNKYL
jgi:hypothetical protein